MARPNPLKAVMSSPLPSITYQRRRSFRPAQREVEWYYDKINYYVFNGQLRRPIIRLGTIRKCWGMCEWEEELQPTSSYCKIRLSDKWFCAQWFVNTLAHEMVHQWQWDVYRFEYESQYNKGMPRLSGAHGPSFFSWRERFAEYGLCLKIAYGQKRWFRHQDFYKC